MIRDEIKQEQGKLKDMTFPQKLKYFWDYYKFHTIVTICIIVALVTLVRDIVLNSREPSIYVAMLNSNYYSAAELTILDDFTKDRAIDTDVNPATLDLSIHFDDSISVDIAMVAHEKFLSLLGNGEMDVLVCEADTIDEYAPLGGFVNLEDFLPKELLTTHKEKLYYSKDTEGKEFPAGIYVDKCSKIKNNQVYPTEIKPIAAISAKSVHTDAAVDFIQYLFEE